MPDKSGADGQYQAIVVGGGPAGLTAAIALAQGGISTVLAGKRPAKPDNRTTALLGGSVTALEALGVWELCAAQSAPLKIMRIVDDTGRLWRAPEVKFESDRNRPGSLRLQYRQPGSGGGAGTARERPHQFTADRRRSDGGRTGRRQRDGHAQERRDLASAAGRRRRRPPIALPQGRRHRHRSSTTTNKSRSRCA